jgi:hypothetical protein
MSISAIRLCNLLCKKLGEEDNNNLAEFVHAEIDSRIGQKSDIFLTKDDKSELSNKINEVKTDLIDRFDEVKTALSHRINGVRVDLIDRMNKNKTEILVWIVGTGILQFLMVLLFRKL